MRKIYIFWFLFGVCFFLSPPFMTFRMMFFPSLFSVENLRGVEECTGSIATACRLSDKHSRCWHYQMLSACRPPGFCPVMARRRGEQPGHLTLSDGMCVCVCVCKWASRNVHAHVTNRHASGVPYQAGPTLTSIQSTSGAVYPSAVTGRSEDLIRALAETSIIRTADLRFKFLSQNSVKGTFIYRWW